MSQQSELQDAVRDVGNTMREHLLQTMQQPGRNPGKTYRQGTDSLADTVCAEVTRFVDDLTAAVREEVDEFARAARQVRKSD